MQKIIEIKDGVVRHPLYQLKNKINLEILDGEQIAIVGNNGSGKSMLVDVLTSAHPLFREALTYNFAPSLSTKTFENIKYIKFRDSYGDADGTYYYQQRWNQHDIDDNSPIVSQLIQEAFDQACADDVKNSVNLPNPEAYVTERREQRIALRNRLYEVFKFNILLDKPIVLLSSGELRKFQLIKTLMSNPRVLILDNPFVGLDAPTRALLHQLLNELSQMNHLLIILCLSKTDDIPQFITHVIEMKQMEMMPKVTLKEYLENHPISKCSLSDEKRNAILQLPYNNKEYHTTDIIQFNNVCIRYGKRTILKDLNWTVRCGERWCLSGENGAGKSTLLSLVCADNPQAYSCDIVLFDMKRGTGESIWDIKKHIGYVSPEMHRAYLKDLPAIDIIASGLHDSVGLYVRPKPEQRHTCEWWMDIFGIGHLKDKTFLALSSGEQRLCLLARAFVKDPELLILDEPLHGLDDHNRQLVKDVIDTFCHRDNKTLIMVTHYQEELPPCINKKLTLVRHS